MENKQHSKVSKWSLILAIVILFNLFINYSVSLVFNSPEYNDFCESERYAKPLVTEMTPEQIDAENAKYEKCSSEYDAARETYERKVFITLISIGVIVFAVSLIGGLNYVLSTSLGLASVLNFVIASMRYWSTADEILKVVILGLALAILIWLGVKKFKE